MSLYFLFYKLIVEYLEQFGKLNFEWIKRNFAI